MQQFLEVFKQGDADSSGQLSMQEFQRHLEDPRIQAYFQFVGLHFDEYNSERIFALLDFDNSGSVDAAEFVAGLSKFRGRARSLDIALLHHDIRRMDKKISKILGDAYTSCSSINA